MASSASRSDTSLIPGLTALSAGVVLIPWCLDRVFRSPLAAGAGAILGAMAPELMAKILLTPHGRTVLKFMMRRGTRVFDPKTIHLIAQTLRGLGQETIRNIPLTNDERQARHLLMQAFKEERLQQRNKKKKRPYSFGSRP